MSGKSASIRWRILQVPHNGKDVGSATFGVTERVRHPTDNRGSAHIGLRRFESRLVVGTVLDQRLDVLDVLFRTARSWSAHEYLAGDRMASEVHTRNGCWQSGYRSGDARQTARDHPSRRWVGRRADRDGWPSKVGRLSP